MKLTSALLEEVLSNEVEYHPCEHREYQDISTFLQNQIKASNLSKKKLFIICDIPESIGYKYVDGTRALNRDTFIKFLIAFKLPLDKVQFFLINFGYGSLYIRNKRDGAIIHAIVNNYSYLQLKQYLLKHNIQSL